MCVSPDGHFVAPRPNITVQPFSSEDPELWFALLESQFANQGITSENTKYNFVISSLDITTAKVARDVILNPPEYEQYRRIKAELIRRLSASHERKLRELLTHQELGDRRPSQLLRHLQDLAGPSAPVDLLRSIWCSRLPETMRTVLETQKSPLEQQAELADRIQEIITPCTAPASPPSSEFVELKAMVATLAEKLDEHTRRSSHCSNPDQPRPQRQRPSPAQQQPPAASSSHTQQPLSEEMTVTDGDSATTSPYLSCLPNADRCKKQQRRLSMSRRHPRTRSGTSHKRYPTCWYHSKYGDKAAKCQQPCDHQRAGKHSLVIAGRREQAKIVVSTGADLPHARLTQTTPILPPNTTTVPRKKHFGRTVRFRLDEIIIAPNQVPGGE